MRRPSLNLRRSVGASFLGAAALLVGAGCQDDAEQPTRVDLILSDDDRLEGEIACDRFVIPSGVTVTAAAGFSVRATEEIVIDGALVGEGFDMLLTSDGSFVSRGEIRNLSNGFSSDRRVSISARDFVDFSGASVITDLPTSIRAGDFDNADRDSAEIRLFEFTFDPGPVASSDGPSDEGANLELRTTGRVSLLGRNTLRTRSGRIAPVREWRGEESDTTAGTAGGPGGRIDLIAREIRMEQDNRMRTGDGGAGGDVRDVAPSYTDRPARDAYAKGGRGGDGGSVALLAHQRSTTASAFLSLELGIGGRGGSAEAIGAAGSTSKSELPSSGGSASAYGGRGGDGGGFVLQGSEDFPSPAFDGRGGDGGIGGDATSRPGRGADGTSTSRDGARSGSAIVHGGAGGDGGEVTLPGETESLPFGAGGDAGLAVVVGGGGGDGYGLCDDGVNSGGRGGDGGRVEVHEGIAGMGSRPGAAPPAYIQQAGNAGSGGDGAFRGRAGIPGERVEIATHPVEESGINFAPGSQGEWCPVGACCFPGGTCEVRTAERCEIQSGYYWGDGIPCDPMPCVGACCFDDNVCRVVTRLECTSDRFFGPAFECDPIPCPLIGSCCIEEGVCVLTTHEDCGAGQFHGVGTGCEEYGCGTIGGFFVCCLPDGSCDGMPSLQCELLGGTAVYDSPCPPLGGCAVRLGACCIGDQCVLRVRIDCAALQGEYHGDGSACETSSCTE